MVLIAKKNLIISYNSEVNAKTLRATLTVVLQRGFYDNIFVMLTVNHYAFMNSEKIKYSKVRVVYNAK